MRCYDRAVPFARPPGLFPKATVRVIAPAGPFDREGFDRGVEVLRSRYTPEWSEGIFEKRRYLAGDDARRRAELEQALGAPEAHALFCARGGYGVMRLMSGLDA